LPAVRRVRDRHEFRWEIEVTDERSHHPLDSLHGEVVRGRR